MSGMIAHLPFGYLMPLMAVPTILYHIISLAELTIQRDRFIARLFSEHRELWDELGGPRGCRWCPPRGERAPDNTPTLFYNLYSKTTPAWLHRAPSLIAEYRQMRANARRSLVAMAIMFGTVLVCVLCAEITR